MSRKRDEFRAQERQARRARITSVLTTALPALTEAEAAGVLTSVRADRGIPLRDLDEYLAAHSDALASGDPACPAVIVRLVQVLRNAGHDGAVLAGCSECGRTGVPLPRSGPGGRVCQACGARNSQRECGRCGRTARIFARRDEGGICYSCYRVDPQIVQECAGCGRARMPVTRRPDGGPLCLDCWTPPTYTCVSCGTGQEVAIRRQAPYPRGKPTSESSRLVGMSPYRRKVPAEAAAELERLAAALEDFRRRSAELAHELAEQIHACLHAGATWGEVGERLGMTKQGAREHWGHYIQGMMDERSVSRPADFPPGSAGAGRRPRAQQSRAGEDSEQGAAP